MQNIIVPFRLNDSWLGLDIDSVNGVEACGKISFVPNSQSPMVGLMQKNGKILPVWSLFPMVNGSFEDVRKCEYFIEVVVQNKLIAIPVSEVLSVTNVINSWVPMFKYGMKMFRSLDKKAPNHSQDAVQEMTHSETPTKGFKLEEIY